MPSNLDNYRRKTRHPVTTSSFSTLDKITLAFKAKKLLNQIKDKPMKGSWKTSLFGAGGLATIAFNVASMLLDNDPNTNPDWSVTITATLLAISALFAKDANVSNAPHPITTAKPV